MKPTRRDALLLAPALAAGTLLGRRALAQAPQGAAGVTRGGVLTAHLAGELSLEGAVAAVKQSTRNYAKRQLTWFRNQQRDWPRHPGFA